MALDALARYVVHMLAEVATDEVGMMLGVSGEIDKMGEKLLDLKNLLTDADRRNITDESVREWVGQLKRAMYEATDILDLCKLKAMERGGSSSSMDAAGCLNPLLFCMRNPCHAREIGTRIKALNKSLDTIKERSATFNFINLGSYEDRHSNKVHASRHGDSSRETSWDLDRLGVVREKIEEDTRTLVARILQTGNEVNGNIMVVAIVGVGGIGKTTLAQKVFNDEAIKGEFNKKIWLSVNQNFSETELLRRVIIEAGGDAGPANAKATLHRILKDALIGHKTLLVMDDVWNNGAWERVLKVPLVNAVAPGSRVLVTTRDDGVAQGMTATMPYHHVDTLEAEDAWSLLKKQVLSSEIDDDRIDMLKDIGLKIIQKCGGLPLAIKVMGGILRKRGELRRDWEQVLDDSKWAITKMPEDLNYAVYLSYEDMSPYLKQCFLYYSLLPNSKVVHIDQVVAMWMSEGFIHENSSDLEELGRSYYKELISRNLLEPNKLYFGQTCCSMHDVVRAFAQHMTKDEAFIAHVGENCILTQLSSSRKFLRLSIETDRSGSDELDWKSIHEQKSVRTLISNINIKMKPGYSLATFSSLRTLDIESTDVTAMVGSLHQLKHLRYLRLVNTDISALPVNMDKLKLLQYLDLRECLKLVNLPSSIVKLGQLRFLGLPLISMIPRGFRGMTSMWTLLQFRAHMDGDWCSLDELGHLSQLRSIVLNGLENIPDASYAANARLGEKMHLRELWLFCTKRPGHDGLVSEEEKRRTEKVFDELCPPPSVQTLGIDGYYGEQLPSWMMSTSMVQLNNLEFITFTNLACCTQLPNGLCQLPYLRQLQVFHAPCIRRVGTGFLQAGAASFPRLTRMNINGMSEWEEWEWEEHVQAMPRLENLLLLNCKLRRVPRGLASNARTLRALSITYARHLSCLESFPFVVELEVFHNPDLERITNFPNLKNLIITNCPKLKVLESISALYKLVLQDFIIETLPEYMRGIKPRHLLLLCSIWLLSSLAVGQSGTEWDRFSHVEHVEAYASVVSTSRKWYVVYRRYNNKLDSNISPSTLFQETLSSSMESAQGFESVYKMRRSTFSYICNLVRIPFFEGMMARDHTFTFVDGRMLSLEDGVAIALKMLNSVEPPATVGSAFGVNESTVSMVIRVFVEAMCKGAIHHSTWPCPSEMEEIKRKFDKLCGLPNCCGVIYTDHIFGSQNSEHEENGVMMQGLVDPDMRFRSFWFDWSGNMNQYSMLHGSDFFKECETGAWLDGSKVKLSDGLDVGEYIIGDEGYPLRPWLLTPYQLEGDISISDAKYEFTMRHFVATSIAQRAVARLKDTWKCLQREGWRPSNHDELVDMMTVGTCCLLHNIVIDMEEHERADVLRDAQSQYMNLVQKVVCEDAVKAILIKHVPHVPSEDFFKVNQTCSSRIKQMRHIASEDAVKVRDALSQHMVQSGGTW